MFFLVKQTLATPLTRFYGDLETIGVVEASSLTQAREKLGLIEWVGWKKYGRYHEPNAKKMTRAKWEKSLFHPQTIKEIEEDKGQSIPVYTLEEATLIKGKKEFKQKAYMLHLRRP